jgi:peptidoglycan glycosyltransferase/penicillin-binding protein 2
VPGLGYRFIANEGDGRHNLVTTVDYHVQKAVEQVMLDGGVKGAAVVLDVVTGDILALASMPDFNQNNVAIYLNSDRNELFNRAAASYNIGSVYKIAGLAALLESGYDAYPQTVICEGAIKVGDRTIRCSSNGGASVHTEVNAARAFEVSCNSFFIKAAIGQGATTAFEYAKKFGFGEFTGIDAQGVYESKGMTPEQGELAWAGDLANLSIGQGKLLGTPIQVANMVAIIANGGIKNHVNVLDSITDSSGKRVQSLRINEAERVIEFDTAMRIKELMQDAVRYGTGAGADVEAYGGGGGKTGSAQTGRPGVVHAWFAGFYPYIQPKYAIAILVEDGQHGGKAAAPLFARIVKELYKMGM